MYYACVPKQNPTTTPLTLIRVVIVVNKPSKYRRRDAFRRISYAFSVFNFGHAEFYKSGVFTAFLLIRRDSP